MRNSIVRGSMAILGLAALTILLAACATGTPSPSPTATSHPENEVEEHTEEHEHGEEGEDLHAPEEHMAGEHSVPAEAAEVPNPIESTDESIALGAELYANACAVCHGETGAGDGPAAAGLEMPPADLREDHVQANSDGALFYIISHGVPESPMPAWEDTLDPTERWHVVNFLRTFGE